MCCPRLAALRSLPLALPLAALLSGLLCFPDAGSTQSSPELLVDVDPSLEVPYAQVFSMRAARQGVVLGVADGSMGLEPWVTDGSAAGTHLVADLCPGFCNGYYRNLGLTRDGRQFFLGENTIDRLLLWVTDGSPAGTLALAEISTFLPGNRPDWFILDEEAGRLFFTGSAGAGFEPWVSDGTLAGTRQLFDVVPGPDGARPRFLAASAGKVFLAYLSESAEQELWALSQDGSWARPLDVAFETAGASLGDGRFLFLAESPTTGLELWVTDGTTGGTRLVKDLAPGPASSFLSQFTEAGTHVVFARSEGDGSSSLWGSDGTERGTVPLLGPLGRVDFTSSNTARMGGRLILGSQVGSAAAELWVTDGTVEGTVRLATYCSDCSFEPPQIQGAGDGVVFFKARLAQGGVEQAFVTDGSVGGTRPLLTGCADACAGSLVSLTPWGRSAIVVVEHQERTRVLRADGTQPPTVLGEMPRSSIQVQPLSAARLVLVATRPIDSNQVSALGLWAADTTAGSLRQIRDFLAPVNASSDPSWLFEVGDRIVFVARRQEDGARLFALEPGATEPVALGARVDSGKTILGTGFRIFFSGSGEAFETPGLWTSDGTAQGTRPLLEDATPACSMQALLGDRLFLIRRAGFRDLLDGELWVSDGSPAGTRLVAAGVGPSNCFLAGMAALGSAVYWVGRDGDLFRSDGTPAGTFRVMDTPFEVEEGAPGHGQIAATASAVYYTLTRGSTTELWVSDGTESGTRFLTLADQQGSRMFHFLTPLGDQMVFSAWKPVVGVEPWISDGTPSGTRMLRDIRPGLANSWPYWFQRAEDKVFFGANDGLTGDELWVTDGTSEGTRLVKDLRPGLPSSIASPLRAYQGRMIFSAGANETGEELYLSDGTAEGTVALTDLAPGAPSSHPSWTLLRGSQLIFAARDGTVGNELWQLDLGSLPRSCEPARELCLLEGRLGVAVRWRDPRSGATGVGVPLPYSNESGSFWFFDPANVELVVKTLDGGAVNGSFWVFYGGLSDVEYFLDVTRLDTGEVRTYRNPPGEICGGADVDALPVGGAGGRSVPAPSVEPSWGRSVAGPPPWAGGLSSCVAAESRLCLLEGRFAVEVAWRDPRSGRRGEGIALPGAGLSGSFAFFGPGAVELVVKMIDGGAVNGQFWFFFGALSDLEYTVSVLDTQTGSRQEYRNPPGEICGQADTSAFPSP
jgi:ELWxxDGT repeat protein